MTLSNTALVTLVQAKNYLRTREADSSHIDAEYVGMGDVGGNKIFTLDKTPIEGSLKLYVVGVLQVLDTDFTLVTATITFIVAPGNNEPVTASYDYAATSDTYEDYDDELIERLIEAATKKAEDYTGRAFVQREIVETRIGDNRQALKLYRQPIVSVDGITVGGDDLASWSEGLSIGRIYHLVVWPLDYEIVVTYTAGYGANRAAVLALVPDAVLAVLIAIATWCDNRIGVKSQSISGIGSTDYGVIASLPEASMRKLDSLRTNLF